MINRKCIGRFLWRRDRLRGRGIIPHRVMGWVMGRGRKGAGELSYREKAPVTFLFPQEGLLSGYLAVGR